MGEALAAIPLVRALRHHIRSANTVTTSAPTGSGASAFGNDVQRLQHMILPDALNQNRQIDLSWY